MTTSMATYWDVIVWTAENSIDYVPTSWSNETSTRYKYPLGINSLKIKKMIDLNRSLENQHFDWLEAVCKVKSVNDLQTAKDLCERGTYTSNLELSDEDDFCAIRRKRKKTVKRHFDETEDRSDNSEDEPLAKGQNLIRKKYSTPSQILSLNPPQTKIIQNKENFRRDVLDCVTPKSSMVLNKTPKSNDMRSSQLSSDLTAHLLSELTEIKFYMKESKATMSRIENVIANCGTKNDLGDLVINPGNSNFFLEKLPCKTKLELEEIDSLISETNHLNQLVNFLYLAGGHTPHKTIYMAMQKLFCKELALLYSGQGKKKKIPFCDMKLYQAVFAAVRKRHPNVTDDSIKKSVSLFLATAKARLGSKDSRDDETEDLDIGDFSQ